jgi:hypothetical protein
MWLESILPHPISTRPDQMKVGMIVPAILQADMRSKSNPFAMRTVWAECVCNDESHSFSNLLSRAEFISISMKRRLKYGDIKVVADIPAHFTAYPSGKFFALL